MSRTRTPGRPPASTLPAFRSAEGARAAMGMVLHDEVVSELVTRRLDGVAELLALIDQLMTTVAYFEQRCVNAESLSLRDPLTGVANRRGWGTALRVEEERHRRTGSPAVVAIIDIDGFKSINDLEGHQAGDAVLRLTATTIVHNSRAGDVIARLGGDEFGVLAFDTTDSEEVVGRVRTALREAGIKASVGAATRPPDGTMEDAYVLADRRMYIMKQEHRVSHDSDT